MFVVRMIERQLEAARSLRREAIHKEEEARSIG
jgi:hypothetical protein